MNIQSISPLASVLTIINVSFLLTDRIRKMNLQEMIKLFLVGLCSTVFIKEILYITYSYQEYIFLGYKVLFISLVISLFMDYLSNNPFMEKSKIQNFIKDNIKGLILFVIVFLSLFFYQPSANFLKNTFVENFSYDKVEFINGLCKLQGGINIFKYLKENLFIALSIAIDTINIFVAYNAMIVSDSKQGVSPLSLNSVKLLLTKY